MKQVIKLNSEIMRSLWGISTNLNIAPKSITTSIVYDRLVQSIEKFLFTLADSNVFCERLDRRT